MGLTVECALVDDVREEREAFATTARGLFDLIGSVQFKDMPEPLGTMLRRISDAVRDADVRLRGEVNALQGDVDAVIASGLGNPCKLRELAAWWTSEVADRVQELPDFLTESALPARSSWKREAGKKYGRLIDSQHTSLKGFAAAIRGFAEPLTDLAVQIEVFLILTDILLVDARCALTGVMPSGRGLIIAELTGGLSILRRIEKAAADIETLRRRFTNISREAKGEIEAVGTKKFENTHNQICDVWRSWECWWTHLETPPPVTDGAKAD